MDLSTSVTGAFSAMQNSNSTHAKPVTSSGPHDPNNVKGSMHGNAGSVPRFKTGVELVEETFRKFQDQPAYTCLGHTLSYSQLNDLSLRFASYLRCDLGLVPGDVIAMQLPNILQFPVALYGAIRAGLIVSNANPLYTDREIKHQLNDSGAKVLVVLANVAHEAAQIISETKVEHVIVTQLADLHPFPKKQLINFVVKRIKKLVKPFSFPKQINFSDTVKSTKSFTAPELKDDDLMMLQYTGGTTGVAKGAMLTHKNITSNVWQLVTHLPDAFEAGDETFIACLPLYHIYAFNIHGLSGFSQGVHNVLIPNPRDMDAFIKTLKQHRFSVFPALNTLFNALLRHEEFAKLDFSSLKITCSGGMALTHDTATRWKQTTGSTVLEGYGLTETCPVIASCRPFEYKICTIGGPVAETEIRLVDSDNEEVPDGQPGELTVRGPQVMKGYYNRPDATAGAINAAGFFATGDIAVKDSDGFYKIVDRKKDMIIVSGFNVYPNEVEDIASSHPDVLDAAAVGVPHDSSGEAVKLFVVKTSGSTLTEQELRDFCREKLTAYKVPKFVEFKPDLPKSAVGKVLRRKLREA